MDGVAVLPDARLDQLKDVPDQLTRTKLPWVLFVASAVFIVYGTTIPFNFVHDRQTVFTHIEGLRANPFVTPEGRRRISGPDFTGNIALFLPFGLFGMWGLRRPESPAARVVALGAASLILSVSVETLQLFTVDRTSSWTDVLANTSGGVVGAVAGMLLRTSAESALAAATGAGFTEAATFFPFLVATAVMLAGAWEPFDVTLDVGSVIPKLRSFLRDPLQTGGLADEGVSFLQHALFASTLVVWLSDVGVRSAAAIAAAVGSVLAAAAEGGQLFIAARMPGLWDAGVGVAGALAGVPAGAAFLRSRSSARWWGLVFVLTAIGVAMQQLSPFTPSAAPRPVQWVPFLNYYTFTTSETVSHSAELLLGYFPLGFAFATASRQRRRTRMIVTLTAALVIALPVEYFQQYIGDRYPDVTDIALSLAGAWLGAWGATRGRRMFDEQVALISRPRPAAGAAS